MNLLKNLDFLKLGSFHTKVYYYFFIKYIDFFFSSGSVDVIILSIYG